MARQLRVFNAFFEFVDFRLTGALIDRKTVPLPSDLMGIADEKTRSKLNAAIRLLDGVGPVSSATWNLDILSADPRTRNGWWLLESRSEQARRGLSAQSMAMWNSEGEAIALASQTVALFG